MNRIYSILFVLCFSVSIMAQVEEASFGEARNEQKEIVYTEKHKVTFQGASLRKLSTLYFDPNNVPMGGIHSDFTKSPYLPEYSSEDKRHGRSESVSISKNRVTVTAKESQEAKQLTKSFEMEDNMLTGQGLHAYLREQVSAFHKDEKLVKKIKFLVPMNQDVFNFRVSVANKADYQNIIQLRVEADSWLFRLIAPEILVKYDVRSKRLLEYKGPSNLLSPKAEKMNVIISYTYDVKAEG